GLCGVFERGYSGAGPLHAVVRVPAGHVAIARGPEVVAELDVLAGDVVLVATAAVVVAGDTRVGRRALRPVHETVLHLQHLGRMVARRQANDERAQLAGVEAGRHDARGVVALAGRTAHALVGVRREESAAGDATLEGQADRRTIRLVAGVGGRIGGRRLEERPANRMPVLVEHQQVRRERIGLREFAAPRGVLVVLAASRQTGARLDD